jgi:hypothetical protein
MPEYVFEYNQTKDLRWRDEKEPVLGVCYGLVTFWIIRKARGENFLQWLSPPRASCPQVVNTVQANAGTVVADVQAMQKRQKGNENLAKVQIAVDVITTATTLVLRDKYLLHTGPIKNKIGFTFIIINGTKKDKSDFGHAIATQAIAPNNVVLFDPNRGEISLSRGVEEARQFIDYLCTNNNQYNLAEYSLQWTGLAHRRIIGRIDGFGNDAAPPAPAPPAPGLAASMPTEIRT